MPVPAAADTTAQQLQQLQQQEASQRASLAQLAQEQASARGILAALRADLAGKNADLAAIQAQAEALDQELQAQTVQENAIAADHDRHVEAFSAQVRDLYKSGPVSTLLFLFGASTFSDLVDRIVTATEVARKVQDQARQLRAEHDSLDSDRRKTAELQASLTPLLDQLAQAQAAAQAAFASQSAAVSQLESSQRATLRGLIGIQRREAQLEKALAAEQAAAAAAARKGAGASYGSSCPTPAAGYVVFCGHGFGHGIGMSQYGAYAMASRGVGWQQILGQYYSGATVGALPEPQTVRILLTGAGSALVPQSAATLKDDKDNVLATVAAGATVQFSRQANGQISATGGSAPVVASVVRLVPAASTFQARGSGRHYRGEAWVDGSGGSLEVVNHVDLELYLQGLGEVPSSWPLGAIEAQVAAARTYAAVHLGGGTYDMDDTTNYQVYLGADREKPSQDQAVSATRGSVIEYQGTLIDAVYSSSDGGHTECASAAWGSGADGSQCSPSYLRGVLDNYDVSTSSNSLRTWYSKPHTVADYQGYLGAVYNSATCGALQGFDFTRDASDRVKTVKLIGSTGVCTVSVSLFKNQLNSPAAPPDVEFYSDLFGASPGHGAWPYW